MHILQEDDAQTGPADDAQTGPAVQANAQTGKRAKSIGRTKPLRKPARPSVTKPPAATDTSIFDADSSDEIELDTRLLQSEDVRLLEAESEYQSLKV